MHHTHHTLILQEGYSCSPLSQRVPQPGTPGPPPHSPICHLVVARQGRYEDTGVNLCLPVPLWRHFDAMAARRAAMRRSCQIGRPVTALPAGASGLTEPVTERRLNKRAVPWQRSFIRARAREEKAFGPPRPSRRAAGGEDVTHQKNM